jgi:transposase
MSNFIPVNRDQAFLLPPDLKSWLPENDLAHFVVAAIDRLPVSAFAMTPRTGGKPQYQPRLMLALLVMHTRTAFSRRGHQRAPFVGRGDEPDLVGQAPAPGR